jgi:hypothetical protein
VPGAIACGGRGTLAMSTFRKDAAVRVAAICGINYTTMPTVPRNHRLSQVDADRARLDIGPEELRAYRKGSEDQVAPEDKSAKGFHYATDLHVANFLECVRACSTPGDPLRLAFQAALVVQMANLSIRSGPRLRWNAAANKVES